jgi:hypothetical protein
MRFRWILITVIALGLGVGTYFVSQNWSSDRQPATASNEQKIKTAPEAEPRYPVPDQSEKAGSSHTVQQQSPSESIEQTLQDWIGQEKYASLLVSSDVIHRFVVAIDNLNSNIQPNYDFSPLQPLESDLKVRGEGHVVLDRGNFERYQPYVHWLEGIDARKLTSIYFRFYPQFQSAYAELGQRGYFNDRLVALIEQVISTPRVDGEIQLSRPGPHYRYKFTDEKLENLPAAQKALIRMGSENSRIVKMKLKQIRNILIQFSK